MKSNKSHKIFGIGLNKTGTTTLESCGKILGYSCTSCNKNLLNDVIKKDFTSIGNTVDKFDFFQDWPYPLIYKELDNMYPNSKFILTIRNNEETWLNSLKCHSLRTHPVNHCRKLAYGYNYPHHFEKEHIDFYINHNRKVHEYFTNRRGDFLEICWENGDSWEKLCSFLGEEVPNHAFPHSNKGNKQKINQEYFQMNISLSKANKKSDI